MKIQTRKFKIYKYLFILEYKNIFVMIKLYVILIVFNSYYLL